MTTLTRFTPLRHMTELQREVDRLFNGNWPLERGEDAAVWAPRTDVSETEAAYQIVMDLPGLSKEQVEITFEDGVLHVTGERAMNKEQKEAQYHRIERSYGRFGRTFNFGQNVEGDKVSASFEDGVLTIVAPKVEAKKPVRISIQ